MSGSETFAGEHSLMPVVRPRATSAQENFLRDQAKRVVSAHGEAGTAYWQIVTYVREQGVPPAEVRRILIGAGWHKSRVAELLSVANTSDQIYTLYRNRFVGFKLALEKTRGAKLDPEGKLELQKNRLVAQFFKVAQTNKEFARPFHDKLGDAHFLAFNLPADKAENIYHVDGLKVTVERVETKTTKTKKGKA